MLWKILRARFWELRHSLIGKDMRQRITNLIFLLVILGGAGSVFMLLINALNGLANQRLVFAMLPSAIFTLIFFMIIQLGDTLNQLYLSPDLFWLNQAPLKKWDIYLAKLVECSIALWLPALFFYALMTALGIVMAASPFFYLVSLLLMTALIALVTEGGMIVIMVLAYVIPAKRIREMMPVAVSVISIGAIIFQRTYLSKNAMALVTIPSLPIENMLEQWWLISLLAVVFATAGGLLGYVLFKASSDKAMNAMQTVQSTLPAPKTKTLNFGLPELQAWLGAYFPQDQLNIIRKDWTILRRDMRRATNLILTPLMMGVIMVPMLGSDDMYVSGYWIMLLYAALFGMNSSQSLAIPSFILEARTFSFIYRSPVRIKSVMYAKFWAAWLPTALVWAIVLSVGALLLHLNLWQWLVLIGMNFVCVAGSCFVGVAASARSADLSALNPQPKLNGPIAWLSMLYGFVWNLAILLLTCCLLFTIGSHTEVVKIFLANLPFTIPAIIYWIGAGIGLVASIGISIPIIALWYSGVHRLEKWQQV